MITFLVVWYIQDRLDDEMQHIIKAIYVGSDLVSVISVLKVNQDVPFI